MKKSSLSSHGSRINAVQAAAIEDQHRHNPEGVVMIEELCVHIHEQRSNGVLHKHRKLSVEDAVDRQAIRVLNNQRARKSLEAHHDLVIICADCGDCKIVVVAVNKIIAKQTVIEVC